MRYSLAIRGPVVKTAGPLCLSRIMNWTLRYLICYAGVAGAQRLDTLRRTGWDALHACQAYLCASKEEWDMLGKNLVSKANRRLYMAVELFCAATGERRKLTGAETLLLGEADASTSDAQFTLDCIKSTLASYAGLPATIDNLQDCFDRIANAVRGTIQDSPIRQESFLDRLQAEKAQLEERWLKLQDFVLTSPKFAELPELQRSMLTTQSDLMRQYLEVLNRRLDLLAMPQSQEGSEPSVAHNPGEASSTLAPATIPQMPGGSRSGGADEAPVEPEGTPLNEPEPEDKPADESAGTLEGIDPADTQEFAAGADSNAAATQNGAGTVVKRAPAPDKPKAPAKKTAKGKK